MSQQINNWLQRYNIEPKDINEKLKPHQSIIHSGRYPIQVACLERNKDLIRELLSKKPLLHVYSTLDGRNILHYCCIGKLELLKIVYNSNMRSLLFVQDKNDMTPLDLALHYNKIDIILYFIQIGLFINNDLLIKYIFRLENINRFILTPIQRNKYRLLTNIVFHKCLNYINKYYNYKTQIGPLFKKNYLYLSLLDGIEGLKENIHDYIGFNSQKYQNIFNFISLFSTLILDSQTSLQS